MIQPVRLVVARHGNTFFQGEKPRRIGMRSDLPLVPSGIEQARNLGRYFKQENIIPQIVFAGELKRVLQTAELALRELSLDIPIKTLPLLNEVDYGVDEGKTEEEVLARIGFKALENWNRNGVVPPGWNIDKEEVIEKWKVFGEKMILENPGKTIFLFTSNGVARFLPYLLDDPLTFFAHHDIKLKTGAFSLIEYRDLSWNILEWNLYPKDSSLFED